MKVTMPPRVPREDEADDVARVVLRPASTFTMRGPRWLWRGRIPQGMVSLLAGREGIGKSTIWADVAARLTRGTLDGRYLGKPQNVVVCATEDSWEYTIVPRLRAVGADMTRVFHIAVREPDGTARAVVAPQDVARMEIAFREHSAALLVVDPLFAVIDGRIDTHKQAEVQQALEPLVHMCERVGMAVLALIHVNKKDSTDPLTNIMGSKAFATLPRSILYCLEEDAAEFLLCHAKCNVGPKQPSIAYRLSEVRFDLPPDQVEDGDDPYISTSRVVWGAEDIRTAADILQDMADGVGRKTGEARTEILALLAAEPGVLTGEQIRDKLSHFEKRQIDNALARAAKANEITRVRRGVYQARRLTPNTQPLESE